MSGEVQVLNSGRFPGFGGVRGPSPALGSRPIALLQATDLPPLGRLAKEPAPLACLGPPRLSSPRLLSRLLLACRLALRHCLPDRPAPAASPSPARPAVLHRAISAGSLPPACLLAYSCARAVMQHAWQGPHLRGIRTQVIGPVGNLGVRGSALPPPQKSRERTQHTEICLSGKPAKRLCMLSIPWHRKPNCFNWQTYPQT